MLMHYEALDKKRQVLLPSLRAFKKDFETEDLYERIREAFGEVVRTQESQNTLGVVVQDNVRISFMKYRYPLLDVCLETEDLRLASLSDIGCMKLDAIVSRAELKDYVDLFFILKKFSLVTLLAKLDQKIPSLDQNLVLKALVSFDDIEMGPIDFIKGNAVSFTKIRKLIIESVKSVPLGIH